MKITNHFQIHRNKTSMVSMMSGSVILREPNKSDKDFSDTHLDVMGIGRIRIYQKILWLCQRSWSCLNDGIKSEDVHSERAYGIQLKGGCRTMRAFTPTPPILFSSNNLRHESKYCTISADMFDFFMLSYLHRNNYFYN